MYLYRRGCDSVLSAGKAFAYRIDTDSSGGPIFPTSIDKRGTQRKIHSRSLKDKGLIRQYLVDFPPVKRAGMRLFRDGCFRGRPSHAVGLRVAGSTEPVDRQLAQVERQDVTVMKKGRASAVRLHAAALRRDIKEAQDLIDQLKHRYLNGGERTAATKRART